MAYTQTIVLHITVPDNSIPQPLDWYWDAELDLHLESRDGNEFHLIDYTLLEDSNGPE